MFSLHFNGIDELSGLDVFDDRATLTDWNGEHVLRLQGARPVLVSNQTLDAPYRLECEVAVEGSAGFAGCVFGASGPEDYQVVYVYPDSRGKPGWVQYDVAMNGSMTWQIYHGDRYQSNQVDVKPQSWIRLRVDIYESRAEITVGDEDSPQLVIEPLISGSRGGVGVWGSLPVYVKSMSYQPIGKKPIDKKPNPVRLPEGLVTHWEVVPYDGRDPLSEHRQDWQQATVEENGILNINRLYPVSTKQVLVRSTLHFHEETDLMLRFGFSDSLRLWVNEEEIYQGTFLWKPPTEDGRIRCDYAQVKCKMKPGNNTILGLLSSEEAGFGWGMILSTSRMEDGNK